MPNLEEQEAVFELPNGATVHVYVTEEGTLKVCATSSATRLMVQPETMGSFSVEVNRKIT